MFVNLKGEMAHSPGPASGVNVKMSVVTDGSEENKVFWKWTPSGFLEFNTANPDAAAFLKSGKQYYVTIELAE